MPDAGVLATLLLIVGLFLIAVELLIPSFGVIGVTAGLCLLVSAWCAHQAWWKDDRGFFWTYAGFLLMGLPASFFGTLYLIQHTALGGFIILRAPEQSEDGPSPEMQSHLHELIGKIGRAVSPLTPGGMVEVQGERHHAECLGAMIDPDQPVEVVNTRGTRLVVRLRAPEQSAELDTDSVPQPDQAGTDTRSDILPRQSGQLDFEIPDNYTDDRPA